MLTALKTIRAENDGGTFTHAVCALESLDTLVVVLLWLFGCHKRALPFNLYFILRYYSYYSKKKAV